MTPLSCVFHAHHPQESANDALENALERLVAEAEEAWRAFRLAREDFVRHVAERVEGRAALEGLRAGDLYLACGCALGVADARRAFVERFGPLLDETARRSGSRDSGDVKQALFEKLLIGPSPAILRYSGRGPLSAYLRVAATREAVRMERRARGPASDPLVDRVDDADPEAMALKERYGPVVKEALQDALAKLTARQRRLLRHHYLDGLGARQIGVLMATHNSTVVRQLAQTREELLSHAHRYLERALKLRKNELPSLVRLVESQVELSLSRLLVSER
jgi:RNA polymerase sigma-70 factor (ECF subfamily)